VTSVVAVIDYGMGNLHSVASALRHVGASEVFVTNNKDQICSADRVVFPGVGAIRDCMSEIKRLECDDLLNEVIFNLRLPVLAICVGMQALMTHSEENDGVDCLNIVEGKVKRFPEDLKGTGSDILKVPHMGWNEVIQTVPHPLWDGIPDRTRFYFVHSYWVRTQDRSQVVGGVDYGVKFDAAIAKDNLFAVQFHPEKSHEMGLRVLKNFLAWERA
tara:strand:- start:972 stop:1619 length:648 start_codon:yes stop_codon:yes gene_type:complete